MSLANQTPDVALFRAQATEAQRRMLKKPQIAIAVTHVFVGGMCARTVMLPAGIELAGAIHLTDHVNIMCGDITIYSEDGAHRLTGYHVIPSCAGTKRIGETHADTCWTTMIKTDLMSGEEVESMLTAGDYSDPRVIELLKRKEIGA